MSEGGEMPEGELKIEMRPDPISQMVMSSHEILALGCSFKVDEEKVSAVPVLWTSFKIGTAGIFPASTFGAT